MNRVVFITGASSGIGEQTAYLFAKAGFDLVLTYHKDEAGGLKVMQECRRLGAKEVLLLRLELADDRIIEETVQKSLSKFPKIDILVNNAAMIEHYFLRDADFAAIDRLVQANLSGPLKLTSRLLPHVTQSIINIGSNLSITGKKTLVVYGATKSALRGFSRALEKEAPNLLIYTIHPPLTHTVMGSSEGLPPQKVAEIIVNAALRRYHAKSGSDIFVIDYLHGEFWSYVRSLLRPLKKLIIRS